VIYFYSSLSAQFNTTYNIPSIAVLLYYSVRLTEPYLHDENSTIFLRASRESWINSRLLVPDSDSARLNNSESARRDKDAKERPLAVSATPLTFRKINKFVHHAT